MIAKLLNAPHVGTIASPVNASPCGLMLIPWYRLALTQEEAYAFNVAREKWAFKHGCLLQANDGCDTCNLEEWGLDWCPFQSTQITESPRAGR